MNETTLHIGGEERPFRLDYKACRQARREKGFVTSTGAVARCATGEMDFTEVIDTFLFIGLYAENKKLAVAQVDEWIDEGAFNTGTVLTEIMNGVRLIFASQNGEAQPEKKPKAAVKK